MVNDHGGFDILAEVGPTLLLDMLRERIDLGAASTNISTPEFSGAIDSTFTIVEVRFNVSAPQVFLFLNNVLTLRLADGTHIPDLTIDSFFLLGEMNVDGLNVLVSSDMAPMRIFDPGVRIDGVPEIELKIAEIIAREGDAAGRAARDRIQMELNLARNRAVQSLSPIRDMRVLTFPAMLAPMTPPTGTLELNTSNASLRLGIHFTGRRGGNFLRIMNDNLIETAGEVSLFIIPNTTLLRDFLRPSVDAQLSLSGNGSFVPSHPFSWSGSSLLFSTPVGNVNLISVRASTNSPNRLVLDLAAGGRLAEGAINAHVRVRATAALAITRVGANLNLMPTLISIEVLESRIDVEWWVYGAIAFGGGSLLLAALTIADSIADGELGGQIAGAINNIMLPTVNIGVPSEIPIRHVPRRVTMLLAEPRILPSSVEPITNDLLVTLG